MRAQRSVPRFEKEGRRNGQVMLEKEKRRELNEVRDDVGAGNEIRTRYLHLGKVALCQMSYARILWCEKYYIKFSVLVKTKLRRGLFFTKQ